MGRDGERNIREILEALKVLSLPDRIFVYCQIAYYYLTDYLIPRVFGDFRLRLLICFTASAIATREIGKLSVRLLAVCVVAHMLYDLWSWVIVLARRKQQPQLDH